MSNSRTCSIISASPDAAEDGLRLSKTWGGGQGAVAATTVEQVLIRGLVTACQVCIVGLPRSDSRRSALPLPKVVEDSPDRHRRPGRFRQFGTYYKEGRGADVSNRPDESNKFASDGGDDRRSLFATRVRSRTAKGCIVRANRCDCCGGKCGSSC